MSVYLSIDLDFWAESGFSRENKDWLICILHRADSVNCYLRHDYALRHINSNPIASKATELWNLDTHSDLGGLLEDGRPPFLNEGTWVDHVRWKHSKTFVWIHPDKEAAQRDGRGRCEGEDGPNPFRVHHSVWPKRRHFTAPSDLNDLDVPPRLIGACVALSLRWIRVSSIREEAEKLYKTIQSEFAK